MAADPGLGRSLWALPAAAGLALALVLLCDVDSAWTLALNGLPEVTGAWPWVQLTALGDGAVLCALLAPLLARRPATLRAVLVAVVVVTLTVRLGKELVGGPRPALVLGLDQLDVIGPLRKRHSFPSGHTTTVFAMAGLVWYASASRALRGGAWMLAAAAGLARVVVGAHWPRDVLGGAGLGWILAWASWWLASHWPGGRSRQVQLLGHGLIVGLSLSLLVDGRQFGTPPALHALAAALGLGGSLPVLIGAVRQPAAATTTRDRSPGTPGSPGQGSSTGTP